MTLAQESGKEYARFETAGFYPILFIPLIFFSFLFVVALYVRHGVGIFVFGSVSVFLLASSFAKIEVLSDGIVVKRMLFGSSSWNLDEVTFKAGGRILAYGGMYGGWVMPLRWEQCFEAVRVSKAEVELARKVRGTIRPYIYLLVPPMTLWLIGNLLRYLELAVPSLLWASLWGIIVALSFIAFLFKAPIRFNVAGLSKESSSIAIGSTIGLVIFLSVLIISNW